MNKGKKNNRKKNKGGGQQQQAKKNKAESDHSWEEMLKQPLQDENANSANLPNPSEQAAQMTMEATTLGLVGK